MTKGKSNSKKRFLILYFLIKSIYIESAVFLPINIFNEKNYTMKNNENNSSHLDVIKTYYFDTLYTIFEIGTPSQKVSLIVNSQKLDYKIINFDSYNKTNYKFPYNFFNESKSKTYKTEGCKDIIGDLDEIETICKSNDTFIFYKDINIKKQINYNNLYFQLIKDNESDIPGEVGIGPFDKNFDEENNFFKILKKNNLINTYYYYFEFEHYKDTNGKLIIGDLPHILFPNKFSEDDLMLINNYIESYYIRNWRFLFDRIFINQTFLYYKKVELQFDSDIIIGTYELEMYLNSHFFNNFTKDVNFFNDTFKPYDNLYTKYTFYYFNINLKETLYRLIPSIKFDSNDLNYTFEITNDELFIIKGNYIYLKILFPLTKQQDYFILGRTFTIKYPFVFNPDLKQIGFYKKFTTNKKEDFNYWKLIKIFIIIFTSILLIIIGIKIGKYLYGVNRKRRANELDDDYEYTQSDHTEKKDGQKNISLIKEKNENDNNDNDGEIINN